jgi:hypothetical protein
VPEKIEGVTSLTFQLVGFANSTISCGKISETRKLLTKKNSEKLQKWSNFVWQVRVPITFKKLPSQLYKTVDVFNSIYSG